MGRLGPGRFSRREFLQYSMGVAAAAGAGSVLTAHGLSDDGGRTSVTKASTSSRKPKRGGTLQAGLSGGSSSDTLDADGGVNSCDFARGAQLYNSLTQYDLDDILVNSLAEEITPNAKADLWTIRLRPGITFHNGKDLTSEDVLFTMQRIVKNKFAAALQMELVDLKNVKLLDKLTVQVPCTAPYSTFRMVFDESGIVPVGYNPKKPVGTGPFMYKSFTPGEESVFVRNPNYWEEGEDGKPLPYLDEVVITDYADETSQTSALISGAVDCIDLLSYESIAALASGGQKSVVSDSGGFVPFTMRCDVYPFSEVDVRQAFRLLVNRSEMREHVFGGRGLIGNDVFGIDDPEYDHALPQRVQDIDQAKFLLNKHKLLPMTTTLVTGPIAQGSEEMATVFAAQATKANVKVHLRTITVTEYYGSEYLKWDFAQDWWAVPSYLQQVNLSTLPNSVWNETHFDDAEYTKLYSAALATTDVTKQTEIVHEMCKIDYTRGGYIIPVFSPTIDGYSPKLVGPEPSKTGLPLSNFGFKRFWFDK